MALGWKYSCVLASAASSRAVFWPPPSAFQAVPLLVEYYQLPLLVSAAVTAMPSSAPLSPSVTLSTCPPARRSPPGETGPHGAGRCARVFVLGREQPGSYCYPTPGSVDRVDRQAGGVRGCGERRRGAVAGGVGQRPLLPLVWSQARKVIALANVPL